MRSNLDSGKLNKDVAQVFNEASRSGRVIACPNTGNDSHSYPMVSRLDVAHGG
jgi:hypothetical protein